MAATRALADSLTLMLERNGQVVQALRHALAGDNRAIEFLKGDGPTGGRAPKRSRKWTPPRWPLDLPKPSSGTKFSPRIFALQRRSERGAPPSTGFRYPPVTGALSDDLDLGIGHLGVDLAAAEGSPIQAVDDGTVLFLLHCGNRVHPRVATPRGAGLHLQALRLPTEKPGRPCGRWRSCGAGGQHGRMDLGAPPALRVVGSRQGCGPSPLVGHSALRPNHLPASRQRQVRMVSGPKCVDAQRRQPLLSQTLRT